MLNVDLDIGTVFKSERGKKLIVLRVAMRLVAGGKPNLTYKDLGNYFATAPSRHFWKLEKR